mmetsp:Transcript_64441/g.153768  ORF Transcript_64441/g.153768 Transcript_64441/m.153768 type:complete len:82 (-) Transcript_64441:8-253(-)
MGGPIHLEQALSTSGRTRVFQRNGAFLGRGGVCTGRQSCRQIDDHRMLTKNVDIWFNEGMRPKGHANGQVARPMAFSMRPW